LESPSAKPAIATASLDTFCDECGAPIPPTDSYWQDHSSGKVGCRGCRDASASDAGGQSADSGWAFVPPAAKVAAHANTLGGSSSGIAPVATKGSVSNSTAPKSRNTGGGGGGGRGKAKSSSSDAESTSGGKAKSSSGATISNSVNAKSSSVSGGAMPTTAAKEGGGGGAPTTAAKKGGGGGAPTATAKEGGSGDGGGGSGGGRAAPATAAKEGGSGCAPTTAAKEGDSGDSGGAKNSQKRPAAAAGLALACPAAKRVMVTGRFEQGKCAQTHSCKSSDTDVAQVCDGCSKWTCQNCYNGSGGTRWQAEGAAPIFVCHQDSCSVEITRAACYNVETECFATEFKVRGPAAKKETMMINEGTINFFTRTSSHVLPLCGVKVDEARRAYVDRQREAAQARKRMAPATSRTSSPILVGGALESETAPHGRRQMADSTGEDTESTVLLTEKLQLLEEGKVIAKKLKAVEDRLDATAWIMKMPPNSSPTAAVTLTVDSLGGKFRALTTEEEAEAFEGRWRRLRKTQAATCLELIDFRDIDLINSCHPDKITQWQKELVPDGELVMHTKDLAAAPDWALQMWQNLDACQRLLSQAVQKQQGGLGPICGSDLNQIAYG
jgi:hypothetical protein